MKISNSNHRALLSFVALFLAAAAPARASILYVDDDAPPGGDGTSWATAHRYLQDALAAAAGSGGAVTEVRVAQGAYKPDQGVGQTAGERNASFSLLDGVALRGGYAGLESTDSDARDIATYETILSGDLNGDDGLDFANYAENALNVANAANTSPNTVLDGFTVSGGEGIQGVGLNLDSASGSFHLSLRVKPPKLDSGVGRSELPVDLPRSTVSIAVPGVDLLPQGRLVTDPLAEALLLQHAQFALGHV